MLIEFGLVNVDRNLAQIDLHWSKFAIRLTTCFANIGQSLAQFGQGWSNLAPISTSQGNRSTPVGPATTTKQAITILGVWRRALLTGITLVQHGYYAHWNCTGTLIA